MTIEVKKTLIEVRKILEKNGEIIDQYQPHSWSCFWSINNKEGLVDIYYRWSPIAQKNGEMAIIEIKAREFPSSDKGKSSEEFWVKILTG